MILDDVMTTGNSLVACRQLLLDAGADEVICAAMSQTTY
jgi:predicted amidophosphoribosyltransferase